MSVLPVSLFEMTAPPPAAASEVSKLIDDVFVTQGAAINCTALRQLLQQLTAQVQPGGGGAAGGMTGGPCGCCCSTSRVTIEGRALKKIPSRTAKPRPSSSKTGGVGKGGAGKEKANADKEHEMILSKLQAVQTMLKAMQQKINKIEARLPKSQSNVSLGKGGGGGGGGGGRQLSKASNMQFGAGRGIGASSMKGSGMKNGNGSKLGAELSASQLMAANDRATGECLCATRRRMRNASKPSKIRR